jgi:putative membrane protein
MPFFGMLMMPMMLVIFLVVPFVIVVPLMRWLGMGPPWWHGGAHNQSFGPSRTALDILNERFARGEIDQAEYEEKRRLISQG